MKSLLSVSRRFFLFLTGQEEQVGQEKRFFNFANLMVMMIQLIYVVFNLFLFPNVSRLVLNSLGFFFVTACFIIGRLTPRKFIVPLMYVEFFLYLAFYGFFWWVSHGSEGSTIYFFFAMIALFLMFLDRFHGAVIGFIMAVFISALFLLEYIHPEWLRPTGDTGVFYLRRYFGVMLGLFTSAFAFIFLKAHYEKVKNRSEVLLGRYNEQFRELRETQRSLSESEERYRSAIEQTGQIVYDYNTLTGTIRSVGAIQVVTGYSEEELNRIDMQLWLGLVHPADRKRFEDEYAQAAREPGPFLVNYRFRRKDGIYIFLEDRGTSLADSVSLLPVRMLGTLKDITDKILDQKRLVDAYLFNQQVIDNAGDGIIVIDRQGKVLVWNKFMENMTNIPLSSIVDQPLTAGFPTIKQFDFQSTVQKVFGGETIQLPELYFDDPADGHRSWINALVVPNRDGSGNILGLIGVIRDTTREKFSLEALSENEERFRTLIEFAIEGIILFDEAGMVIEWNRAIESILGIRKADAVGKTYWEVQYSVMKPENRVPERQERIKQTIQQVLKTGSSELFNRPIAAEIQRPDGTRRTIQQTAFTIKTKRGYRIGLVIIDVTDQIRTEESIRELNENLQVQVRREIEKNREKDMLMIQQSRLAAMGEMVQNIAHQWRQPLNAAGIIIQSVEEYYKNGHLTEEFLGDSVKRAMDLIQHMSKTIDDFRNFFRQDKEKESFSVREAIGRTVSLIEAALKNSFIRLETMIQEDVMVMGYPNEFNQVLLNILNNAKEVLVHRNIEEPRIVICAGKKNGRCVLTISDNGGGIDPAIREKIFEPYFTTKESGTGIGLYMSKMIIEKNMNGKLLVKNVEGGAEFTILV